MGDGRPAGRDRNAIARAELRAGSQRIDLGIGRKAAGLFLRELQLPVHADLKDAAARAHIGDLGVGQLLEPRSRTESARLIVSLHAVFDDDLHGTAVSIGTRIDSYATHGQRVEPVGWVERQRNPSFWFSMPPAMPYGLDALPASGV